MPTILIPNLHTALAALCVIGLIAVAGMSLFAAFNGVIAAIAEGHEDAAE